MENVTKVASQDNAYLEKWVVTKEFAGEGMIFAIKKIVLSTIFAILGKIFHELLYFSIVEAAEGHPSYLWRA